MNKSEREFYNDIQDAVSDWDCSFEYYHEDSFDGRYFCIDIVIDDEDAEWDDVWDAVEEVTDDWGAGIDSSGNEIYVALNLSD